MILSRLITVAMVSLLALEAAVAASSKRGFESFTAIGGRNIFNPDRQMDAAAGASAPAAPAAAPVAASDAAALTGTLLTGRKTLAFFSGSRPEWCGVMSIGASIAGARITKITREGIEVEREGKLIAVSVGQSVPLDANSAPAPAPVFSPSSSASSPQSAPPTQAVSAPASNSTAPADREALIRRMMEKRQQELK